MQTLDPFSETALSIKEGSIYEHYKGMRYRILGVARHSETLEELVVYRALYDDEEIWVRPLEVFVESVNIEGRVCRRFKRVT